ncbi:MAG: cation:proton antiporter [Nanoarchaeota archaeon]|nr:cation:proton antiporter [Nanoarchaeota archaeon]
MEIISAIGVLTLFSITIFLGYIGNLIFERTKIPDIVWLLLFGLFVGPIFNLIDTTMFVKISPLFGAVALLIILFDAGLNMNFYTMIKEFPRATTLAIIGMISSMAVVGLVSIYMFNFDIYTGIMIGAILGGISSPIVISIVSGLELNGKVKTILELESILTDPLCIIVTIALIQLIVSSFAGNIVHDIIASFSIGIVIGSIVGLIWLSILHILRKRPFGYMITLAILLILYAFVETIAGSGAIAALFFGLVLGNGRLITKVLKFKRTIGIKPFIRTFHREMSFFIRSFFFVFLGLIVEINMTYVMYGVVIAAILILLRIIVAQISMIGSGITKAELNIMRIMTPRGLAAAVLAQLPLQAGIVGGNLISNIVFVVILITVLYASFAIRFVYKTPKNLVAIGKKENIRYAKEKKSAVKEGKLQKAKKLKK